MFGFQLLYIKKRKIYIIQNGGLEIIFFDRIYCTEYCFILQAIVHNSIIRLLSSFFLKYTLFFQGHRINPPEKITKMPKFSVEYLYFHNLKTTSQQTLVIAVFYTYRLFKREEFEQSLIFSSKFGL